MTPDDDRPDLDEAARRTEASRRQAEIDSRSARERARRVLSLAERLRRLREANGFEQIMDEAFGGGHA